jgi:para-aminobenzoate synthetase component 1
MVDLAALPIALPAGVEPWHVFAALAECAPADEPAVWLDSAYPRPGLGDWSMAPIGPPAARLVAPTDEEGAALVADALPAALDRLRGGADPAAWRAAREGLAVPFAGGAVAVLAYDLGRAFERVRTPPGGLAAARGDHGFPAVVAWTFAHALAYEHARERLVLAGTRAGLAPARAREAAIALARSRARGAAADRAASRAAPDGPARGFTRGFTDAGYVAAVGRAQELIRAGDIFEVNLAQRFETRLADASDPLDVYLRLRALAPAPFAAFVRWGERGGPGERALLSASPERVLRVSGPAVEARPIKGTRARGADAPSDRRALAELAASAKDRAELAMIIDLLRNDLGRVARPGGVRVVDPGEPIAFPQVHHLVGHVAAELAPGRTSLDAIRAAFPCGSITGAPKPRAMEVIDLVEPVRRGPYTGSVGWVGADLDADLDVAIRTIAVEGRRAWFAVGGAVTIDSDPAAELEETLVKGRALARALGAPGL